MVKVVGNYWFSLLVYLYRFTFSSDSVWIVFCNLETPMYSHHDCMKHSLSQFTMCQWLSFQVHHVVYLHSYHCHREYCLELEGCVFELSAGYNFSHWSSEVTFIPRLTKTVPTQSFH